jgi:hypothetical protein
VGVVAQDLPLVELLELPLLVVVAAVVLKTQEQQVVLVVAVSSFSNGHNKWQLAEDLMVV